MSCIARGFSHACKLVTVAENIHTQRMLTGSLPIVFGVLCIPYSVRVYWIALAVTTDLSIYVTRLADNCMKKYSSGHSTREQSLYTRNGGERIFTFTLRTKCFSDLGNYYCDMLRRTRLNFIFFSLIAQNKSYNIRRWTNDKHGNETRACFVVGFFNFKIINIFTLSYWPTTVN